MTEEEVFLAIIELPNPAEHAAYLDQVCGGDSEFRRRVEVLLAAHFSEGGLLDELPSILRVTDEVIPRNEHDASEHANPVASVVSDESHEDAKPQEKKSSREKPHDLHFLQPSSRPDALGRIGHYDVLQVIGRGGFGIVLRAFDDVLQRVVALKVLDPVIAGTSPARKRFLREARSSAQIRQENVVQVYAVEEEPLPYLVMEFVPGETLQQRLDRTGPLDVLEIVRIGRQVAEGLAAAHATGLIHRDIKPGNILIEGEFQRARITDFGLARAADDASLTQSGMLAGTPMYMAPEQAKGVALDHRADLFSLGSVLYVMATGRPPFRAATTYAVLKRVIDDVPRPIREVIPELPPWLDDMIARLQAKQPNDRFQSAREVADVFADVEARLRANASLDDLSQIIQNKPATALASKWKWIAAVALLLPLMALGIAELTGVTVWSRIRQSTQNPPSELLAKDVGENLKHPPKRVPEIPSQLTNSMGMKFNLIPTGRFRMGSSEAEISQVDSEMKSKIFSLMTKMEGPEHDVEIIQPFYISVMEVTFGQFRQFVEDDSHYDVGDERWKSPGFPQSDIHPVTWVSWLNADRFCTWLSEKEGRRYRLPTEAEWEYCCRAGKSGTRYCFGNDNAELINFAWCSNGAVAGTHAVGEKQPNAWGLHDMHGNVFEFCQDYHDPVFYKSSPVKSPKGPLTGINRVFRGGAWNFRYEYCRSAFRTWMEPHERRDCVGFRVVLIPPAEVIHSPE